MLMLCLSLADGEALQGIAQRAGLVSIVRQLATQLPQERRLPHDAVPVLSVRYGDETIGTDVYDDKLAAAMWDGMQGAAQRVNAKATA